MLAAIFLTGFKLLVGAVTGSLGILSEALHSALDLVAALVTYFSVRISDRPADENHNFGHGKVENLSAFIETVLLLITCIWIIYEATTRLITGNTHIEVTVWSFAVVILSIAIDYTRSRALHRMAKKHNSQALEADALHFSTDIWSSAVVLLGLVCAKFELYFADSVAALAVALIVLGVSVKLGRRAIDVLLDRAPKDLSDKVEALLKQQKEVKCYHDLQVRVAGADTFINVTIHLNPDLSLAQAHTISHKVEKIIRESITRCKVQIHYEPHEAEAPQSPKEIHKQP